MVRASQITPVHPSPKLTQQSSLLPLTSTSAFLPAVSCRLQRRDWDLLLTAETHNFPCAVAPYPGGLSATVAGPPEGRVRVTKAVGYAS